MSWSTLLTVVFLLLCYLLSHTTTAASSPPPRLPLLRGSLPPHPLLTTAYHCLPLLTTAYHCYQLATTSSLLPLQNHDGYNKTTTHPPTIFVVVAFFKPNNDTDWIGFRLFPNIRGQSIVQCNVSHFWVEDERIATVSRLPQLNLGVSFVFLFS